MENEHVETMAPEASKEAANTIVRYHVMGAVAVGLLPFPVIDYVALTGVQINMLRKLAQTYQISFFQDKVKNLISPLIGAAMPGVLGTPLAVSLVKFVPALGTAVGLVAMPIMCGAVTYALGKVFIQHFASGGTILTFDPEKVRDYYLKMFEEGKKVAAEMHEEQEKAKK